MKRFLWVLLSVLVICQSVYASDVKVSLDGKEIQFDTQKPMILNDRIFIPLRCVFENLGYSISWDNSAKTAHIAGDEKTICLTVGNNVFYIDGEPREMSDRVVVVNGAILIPLRDVVEATGLTVNWNGEAYMAELISDYGDSDDEELETVRQIAGGFISITAVEMLMCGFIANDSANILDISADIAASKKDDILREKINNALNTCDSYIKIIDYIPSSEVANEMCEDYKEFINCVKSNYGLLGDMSFTDKYTDKPNENKEFQEKAARINRLKETALNNFLSSFNETSVQLRNSVSATRFNVSDESELTGEQIEERCNYYRTIGSSADIATAFLRDKTALYDEENYINAAKNLKRVLNSTDTPTNCIFERELMLMCCDLLQQAGENVPQNFSLESDNNVILLDCSIKVFEELFEIALNDYYTVKYSYDEGGTMA